MKALFEKHQQLDSFYDDLNAELNLESYYARPVGFVPLALAYVPDALTVFDGESQTNYCRCVLEAISNSVDIFEFQDYDLPQLPEPASFDYALYTHQFGTTYNPPHFDIRQAGGYQYSKDFDKLFWTAWRLTPAELTPRAGEHFQAYRERLILGLWELSKHVLEDVA